MRIIRRTKQFIQTTKEAFATYSLLRQFLKEGCLTIETYFYHLEKKYVFTTTVQLDADIINYIPPLQRLNGDNEFLEKYQYYFKQHQHRISDKIWAISHANSIVDYVVGVFTLFFVNAVGFYLEIVQSVQQRGIIATASVLFSFLFWKYIRRHLAAFIFRLIFLNLRWRLSRRKKKFTFYWQ